MNYSIMVPLIRKTTDIFCTICNRRYCQNNCEVKYNSVKSGKISQSWLRRWSRGVDKPVDGAGGRAGWSGTCVDASRFTASRVSRS